MEPAAPSIEWLLDQFDSHLDAAFNLAHRVTWSHADAQDVVQNAFVRAAMGIEQLRDRTRFRSWLLSITYREAVAVVRARRETPTDPALLPQRPDSDSDPATVFDRDERARLLRSAIARLPESLRVAVVLRDMEQLPMAEVAEVLGVGTSAAKMRVTRGREWLRVDLAGRV